MTTSNERSDTDLLLAYGRDGDEAAFEALAARHVDMIFSVSLRRSHHRQLAEEATQNVLVILSMKAKKLALLGSSLSGWLHTATKFEVAKLQRRETRVKRREQAYANDPMKSSAQNDDENFLRLIPLLDQAIDHLRASDREVIVRRYLEGQDFNRIGEALGISEDAAQKRASRAFERLNQFFRRKAGVTVSATALAAGIGQHCADAAPAVCLQIAGKTAATGLASTLTTVITTMSISKIAAVFGGTILLGGAVAFVASQSGPSPATVASSPPSDNVPFVSSATQVSDPTLPASTGNATAQSADAKPNSANEELADLEAMSPHPSQDEMVRRLSVKHEQLLKDLTVDLGLNDTEAADVKKLLDARLNAFRASLDHQAAPGVAPEQREKQMVTKAGGLIRGVGLREELAGVLSEKQLTAFDEREDKILQSQVESLAYRELAKIGPVLKLKEEQKNRAFELLQTSSAEKLKKDGDARAFMALMQNQAPAKLEMTDYAEAEFLSSALDGPNPMSPESPEFKKKILEVVGGQIRKQVRLLAPVLDQRQRNRYREYLVSKSVLPMFGIKFPAPAKK
jgi:RNA polymerase sigma factor (sigma-70 family)